MQDEYASESKFLEKNYKAFLYDYLTAFKSGNDQIHIHPPPAFRNLYKAIIERFVKEGDELPTTDLVTMMDMVAKFMSYLNKNGIEYDNFTGCPCTRLTDEDLLLLLESGGENR